jgi:PIN domain nuclease of toxin-antitoxin system
VKALLDAHAFIWWVLDVPDLSETCLGIVSHGDDEMVVSVASSYDVETIW